MEVFYQNTMKQEVMIRYLCKAYSLGPLVLIYYIQIVNLLTAKWSGIHTVKIVKGTIVTIIVNVMSQLQNSYPKC